MAANEDLNSVEKIHTFVSLDKWPVFSLMGKKFVQKIHSFIIYGETGSDVIVVTKNDVVFHMNVNNITQMTVLSELRGKSVHKIAAGKCHICALTLAGDVYVWGENNRSQLGTSSKSPMKINFKDKESIVDIDCGDCLTLALTGAGQVYAWGYNKYGECGTGNTRPTSHPTKVLGHITGYCVRSIACGKYHSVVITSVGTIYAWGNNYNGQLGLGHTNRQSLPVQIPYFNGIKVSKVVAGYYHTMILSYEGSVYTFGRNLGQLGTGDTTNLYTPYKLDSAQHHGPFVDIATHKVCYISAAVTITGKILVWGDCRKPVGLLLTPTVVNVGSMGDAFGLYGKVCSNYHSMTISGQKENPLTNRLSQSFDDPITSSFQFVIDGRPIHVHKDYLNIRCDIYMRRLLDTNETQIEIKDYSYDAFKAFLRYLYTNDVFVAPDIGIKIWVELLDLANTYAETDLKQKCSRHLRNGITVENVALIYGASIKHSVSALRNVCFSYADKHYKDVIKTQAFNDLDISIRNDFIKRIQMMRTF